MDVAITGMGCVTCLGNDVETSWNKTSEGQPGLLPVRRTIPATSEHDEAVLVALAGAADDSYDIPLRQHFARRQLGGVDRFASLAAAATFEALTDARLLDSPALTDAGLIYGAASGGNVEGEAAAERLFRMGAVNVHPMTIPRAMSSAAASHLSMLFGIRGIAMAITSACASSAHAISEGMHLIRSGRAKIVVVGGSDASLTFGLLTMWRDLQATSQTGCRPFSADRDGTVIAEGAGTLILESVESATARGAPIHALLSGSAANSDASHITQPCSDNAARAIRLALNDAGIAPDTPMLISAHGSGTALNDASEAQALHKALGSVINTCHVIATKSVHGHALGATAAIELILGIRAINAGLAPMIANCTVPDDRCALPLAITTQPIDHKILLSPTFGFGGLNCVLVAQTYSS